MPAGADRPGAGPLRRVGVAASGGMDSTALLHCVARAAAGVGVEVHALHVHHGLQPAADDWMRTVRQQCRRWSARGSEVHFHAHRVDSKPPAGASVEAWARSVRYGALGNLARDAGCGVVLLAHHRRDQAETVILQALRGAGAAGLAAMPAAIRRDGILWIRPWLDQPRSAIESYVQRWRLAPVADPSNRDPRWARSRLRSGVWPVLTAQFSEAETALAAVARHAQEARALADEIAAADLERVVDAGALQVAEWAWLSAVRRTNVLRHWLPQVCGAPVPETLVQRLARELPAARHGEWPAPGTRLALHRGRLFACDAGPPTAAPELQIDLSQPGVHVLDGWAGALEVTRCSAGGVPADALAAAEVRPRLGGERFAMGPGRLARCLKKQFQAASVPRWLRGGPLVFGANGIVFVAGLGLDARACSWPGAPRVQLRWLADASCSGSGQRAH